MSKISKNKKSKMLFASALLGIASIVSVPILLTSCGNNNSSVEQSIDENKDSENNENNNNNNDNNNDNSNNDNSGGNQGSDEQSQTETADIILNTYTKDGKKENYFKANNNLLNFDVITSKQLTAEQIMKDIYSGVWNEKTISSDEKTYVIDSYKDVQGFRSFLNYGWNKEDGGKEIYDKNLSPLKENYVNFDAISSNLINGSATVSLNSSSNVLTASIKFSLKEGMTWDSKETYDVQFDLKFIN